MSAAATKTLQQGAGRRPYEPCPAFDWGLIGVAVALGGLGLVMVASASMDLAGKQMDTPFHYLQRQIIYAGLGLACAAVVVRIPVAWWQWADRLLLVLGAALLMAALVPGLGQSVNGSQRWLSLGIVNVQVSEPARLFVIVYLAGYLVRYGETLRQQATTFVRPVVILALLAGLLLAEPDFGAAVVLMATGLGMLFLAGVRLWHFGVVSAVAGAGALALAFSSPYRLARLTSFLNPWADPFDQGFQLTQSLIAIGRGEWWGVGLGNSVQKLFYLPEAHTDFLFAVMAEELGLVGVLVVLAAYLYMAARAFGIGSRSEHAQRPFGAYVAYGIGIWLGLQAFINIGVNMGVLPTKGLTLPLMSYGGSSLLVTCAALGLLLRIDHEARSLEARSGGPRGKARRRQSR